MADALRARQQRVVELDRIEVEVALDILEPFERIAGGRLEAQHLGAPRLLVFGEGGGDARLAFQMVRERDRAFHRELGSRAHRKVRGRGGVAHEHDVLVGPLLAQHARKIEPARAAQVTRVRHQTVAAEIFREDALAGRDRFLARHRAETEPVPGRLRALDDEGRGVGVELIGVRPDPAVLGFLENEGEGVVEFLAGAEPYELAFAQVDLRPEMRRKLVADLGVQAVRGDHKVVRPGEFRGALDLGPEAQVHAECARPLLQQQKQLLAPDAAEAVPGGDDALAAVVDRDVVPIGEVAADRGRADGIIGGKIGERLVGQHHAPAEGVVRPVALVDGNVVRSVAQLHADREIKASRAAAEARDLHALPSSLSAIDAIMRRLGHILQA